MKTLDMGSMTLEEFCNRLRKHPEQRNEPNINLLMEIFPECKVTDSETMADETTDVPEIASGGLTSEVYNQMIGKWHAVHNFKMKMGKHTATHYQTCERIIDSLISIGMNEAASWAIWMLWHRLQDGHMQHHLGDEIGSLSRRIRELNAEIESLKENRALTKDGKDQFVGDQSWYLDDDDEIQSFEVEGLFRDGGVLFVKGWTDDPDSFLRPQDCYSTREALVEDLNEE